MRIKFLSIIASFFMMSFFITSCLKDDNNIEYSPDATIHAFELDTIGYGKKYKFTIDQLQGNIYNEDSLPVHSDTIIDRILIKTLTTVSGIVTMKDIKGEDSVINIKDSIDLRKPLKLTVYAPDYQNKKTYTISVRVHQQVPDSLNWGKEPRAINPVSGTAKQKLIILNDRLLLFTEGNAKVYSTVIPVNSTPSDPLRDYGKKWTENSLVNMPEKAKLSSLVSFTGKLYLATGNGEVYHSGDGISWEKDANLSQSHVENLITSFSDKDGANNNKTKGIAGIIKDGKTLKFNFTNKEATAWGEATGETVPENFPIDHFSSDVYSTESGTLSAVVVGNTKSGLENDTLTIVWASENGKNWYPMNIESTKNCPKLSNPSIIRYNSNFYICGKDKEKGFQRFYSSPNTLVWNGEKRMFLLPGTTPSPPLPASGFSGTKAGYSMIVDKNHFIWMAGSDPVNAIWRGRVNKLGFKKQ